MFQDFIANYAGQLSTLAALFLTINLALMHWLSNRFKYYEDMIKTIEKSAFIQMKEHEESDQKRHEEALYRFEKISVALARLGSSNGQHE